MKLIYAIVSLNIIFLSVNSEKEFKLAMLCYFIGIIGGMLLRRKNDEV